MTVLLLSGTAAFGQQIVWLSDLDEAKKLARQTGKPIMYDFTAKWCGPCRRMDKEFWPRVDVVELSKQFVCVKVDYDREKDLRSKYNVNAIPNVVFTDPWGRPLLGQLGFSAATESQIFEKIKVLPKDFSALKEAGDTLEANDSDLASLHQFAQFYQEQKMYWIGSEYLRRLILLESEPAKRENVLTNLAFNHLRLGAPTDAITSLDALRKEYPASPQNELYLYGLVIAHSTKNNLGESNRLLAELKKKYPKSKYITPAEQSVETAKFGSR